MIIYGIFIFFIFFIILIKYLYNERHNRKPKEFILEKIGNYGKGNIKNGYSKRKIKADIDVIVIGSGLGGLTTAALLSKVGKRVLVLEQHYIAGGCTHSFIDKGYEFDIGLHYVGHANKLSKLLDLITYQKIKWDKMGTKENGFVYDEIVVENKTYNFKAGEKEFIEELSKHFPKERNNIQNYIKDVKRTSRLGLYFKLKIVKNKFISKIVNYLFNKSFFKSLEITAYQQVAKYIKNKKLQTILMGQFGDYGRSPYKENSFIHSGVVNHYLDGGWYPAGGTSEIAKKIIPIIESTGGCVLVRKAVESIIIKNNQAIGVKMSNGDEIFADKIVSACGLPNTYKKLIPKDFVKESKITKLKITKLNQLGVSGSLIYLFVGIKGSPEKLNLRSSNIWHIPGHNIDYILEKSHEDPINNPLIMFIGFPCAKDSKWNERFPNKSNAVILCLTGYDYFKKWNTFKQGKRGDEYQEIKKKLENKILEEGLYHYYPQTKGLVDYVNLATPLTFNHYINSTKGEAYGLETNKIRFDKDDWINPKTEIKNLYLTGQDILSAGISGAIMSGVITAHSILDYGTITDLLSGRNLLSDINHIKKILNNHINERLVKKKSI